MYFYDFIIFIFMMYELFVNRPIIFKIIIICLLFFQKVFWVKITIISLVNCYVRTVTLQLSDIYIYIYSMHAHLMVLYH